MGSMKAASIGVCVHSGWAAVVAITGGQGAEEVLDRRRVVIIDSKVAGADPALSLCCEKGNSYRGKTSDPLCV